MATALREPKLDDQVASLSIIMLNAFHLNCKIFAPTREKLDQAVGKVLAQVHFFLGEVGYGKVTNETSDEIDFVISELNDPKVNCKLILDLPDDCTIQDESRFLQPLD
jgi:hypothetical protein